MNTVGNYACRESGCVQSCVNPQDHSCTCCDGFRLYNNSQCVDIDECDESIDECDMNCHNTNGSYECSCISGFQLVNGTKCIDIDECLMENGGCDDLCMNTKGSHYCFDLNITSIESLECDTFGQNEYCTIEENPSCSCCSGFVKENSVCIDIDECLIGNGVCNGLCLNSNGSYTCVSNEPTAILLVIIALLIIALFTVLTVVTVVSLIMFARHKKHAYQSVIQFKPKHKDREPIYDVPKQENAIYDDISEASVEVYPAPDAAVQLIN